VRADLKEFVTYLTVCSRQHYTSQRQGSACSQRSERTIEAPNSGTHQRNFPQVRHMKQHSCWD